MNGVQDNNNEGIGGKSKAQVMGRKQDARYANDSDSVGVAHHTKYTSTENDYISVSPFFQLFLVSCNVHLLAFRNLQLDFTMTNNLNFSSRLMKL